MTIYVNIDDLARKIAAQLRDDNLWSHQDIAAYLSCKPRTVAEYYSLTPGFPKAIRLPNLDGKNAGDPRYVAAEIKAWALKYQGGARSGRRRKQ